MAQEEGFPCFLMQFDRQQVMPSQHCIDLVPVLRSNPQRKATIGSQLAGDRNQHKFDPRLLQDLLSLENPVDRMEDSDKVFIVNHVFVFLKKWPAARMPSLTGPAGSFMPRERDHQGPSSHQDQRRELCADGLIQAQGDASKGGFPSCRLKNSLKFNFGEIIQPTTIFCKLTDQHS
jgi:hypothetical protein